MSNDKSTSIVLFEQKNVRRVWHNNEWYFVIEDVVKVLIDSLDPKQYIRRMKQRDPILKEGWVQFVPTLWVETSGGKQRMSCSNTKGVFRIIQSIPSTKAEPFKLWLAEVGKQRLEEIENPELAMDRMKQIYESKGYPKEWIEKRLRGIAIRNDLTDEWKNRGAAREIDFAILTNEITHATFGMNVSQYKDFKGLQKENLRDSMTDMELILTMLGEATATSIHKERDTQGLNPLKKDASEAGEIAGNTRKQIEKATGKKVSTKENYESIAAAKRPRLL
jgi:prophage antirepressor-like protein